MVVCVLDSQSTSHSISEDPYLREKLKSYSAGPPKPELISRGERQGGSGEPFPQMPQALGPGDHLPRGQLTAGEGGGESLVL